MTPPVVRLSAADKEWLVEQIKAAVEEAANAAQRGSLEHVGGYDGATFVPHPDDEGARARPRRPMGFSVA